MVPSVDSVFGSRRRRSGALWIGGVADVKDVLILQAGVAADDEAELVGRAEAFGEGDAGVVDQLGQTLAKRTAGRSIDELAKAGVLGLGVVLRFGGVGVFEPAIGIGDFYAVVVVDDVGFAGWGRSGDGGVLGAAEH